MKTVEFTDEEAAFVRDVFADPDFAGPDNHDMAVSIETKVS
jgi:hypothetical protein